MTSNSKTTIAGALAAVLTALTTVPGLEKYQVYLVIAQSIATGLLGYYARGI